MVIDARPHLERIGVQGPAPVAETAARLAAAVATDPAAERAVAARGGVDALAEVLIPIATWAFEIAEMTDPDAVRMGVIIAGTRLLLGTPRAIVLAALHEVPAILVVDAPTRRHVEEITIEVGLRLRGERAPSGGERLAG